ncbi:MAG: hypothetical protein GY943_18125 [Chloroflexi bacterium]|nr:hypothetical protein [Chloroflexota bacterium]
MKKTNLNLTQFALSMVAYTILLIIATLLLKRFPETPWQIPIALIPVIPGLFATMIIVREISQRDELQRQIQLKALAFAFCGTALTALSIGLLENAGVKQLNGGFYVPIMMGLWGVGQFLAGRKY